MDFFKVVAKEGKNSTIEVHPNFANFQFTDLMVRGGSFYAVWNEEKGLWSRGPEGEYDVIRIVDEAIGEMAKSLNGDRIVPKYLRNDDTGKWKKFKEFCKNAPDNHVPLDTKVTFSNTEVKKEDYVSKRLPYPLAHGDISAWDELLSKLYEPEERAKIEWAIGAIVSGDSTWIQKFLAFYGPPASGKGTVLRIIGNMFEGYTTSFQSKELGSSTAAFAMEVFRDHPLVAIDHDGNLSRIDDNTRFNTIISHEEMTINEKYRSQYKAKIHAMLFVGTNQPVKISDAKSGLLRRLIDVVPTGEMHTGADYDVLMERIPFEYGAIAHHCLKVYEKMGSKYYDSYIPEEQRLYTDVFFNFIVEYFDVFKEQDGTTLKQAWDMYKEYCEDAGISHRLQKNEFGMELRNYFHTFAERANVDGKQVRNLYEGFVRDKHKRAKPGNGTYLLVIDKSQSLFDEVMSDQPAQKASESGTMYKKWATVHTKLKDLDTSELHWVRVPENHVVIDFDLETLEENLAAASGWPSTYAELSKSGVGVHLHYEYEGDIDLLAHSYEPHIEVKTFNGDASLRRKLSWCNSLPIAKLNSGLPLKKQEKMLKTKTINTERGLRELIERNLRKEIHPGTKPSIDFIAKILDDAYKSGMQYDVTDLQTRIIAFAANSSNQSGLALKVVRDMKWASENPGGEIPGEPFVEVADDRIAFFDVEVYKNLFVVCWKFQGGDSVVKMINPKPLEIESLFKLKLVGFYNRRYDNHILYAASMGATNEQLFKLSTKIIDGNRSATFGAAYNLSYADIWDFSSERMSLKKFEIKLGILHMELDIPWDAEVEEKDVNRVVEYCANDVRATEAVFEDRKGDFVARQILAELSGLSVNDTTPSHTAKIILQGDKDAHKKFVYTDLSQKFPGYTFELGKSEYRGEDPGEGGYVYAEPGIYEKVVVMDVVSMHPASIEALNLFGPYTKNFSDLKKARIHIKHGEFDDARRMLNGKLEPYLKDESTAEQLAYALKLVINTVYGLTSAKFENPFRDIRNRDNIVAKRGALFMIDLKHYLQDSGYQVIHIKTDSVKIPNADPGAIAKVMAFGQSYGYEFEHEETYDKFILVNDAVFVGGLERVPWDGEFPGYDWKPTGAQFLHPYVFKTLFSRDEITFEDMCEARSVVKGTMYLCDPESDEEVRHVGRTGLFVPVLKQGYRLMRKNEDKYYAVSGTKGHLWLEAQVAQGLDDIQIDMSYFEKLADDAISTIEKFGDFETLLTPGK